MAARPLDYAMALEGAGEHEPAVREYLKNGGQNLDPATTAWCAAYVNASLGHAGVEGTKSQAARSFLNWGTPVLSPRPGDVAISERQDPKENAQGLGHAGFYLGTDPEGTNYVLGGNTSDMVATAGIPENRMLGYRRPPETLPEALSNAVKPGTLESVDLSRNLPTADPRRTAETGPFEAVGGTTTPNLASIFEEAKKPREDPRIAGLARSLARMTGNF